MSSAKGQFIKGVFQDYTHPKTFELVSGVSGQGKSTFFMKIIKREIAWMKFIFDHQDGEMAHRMGYKAVSTPDELMEKSGQGGYIFFDYRTMFGAGHKVEAFDFFSEFVFDASGAVRGRKMFICDELHKLIDQRNIAPGFQKICDEGRRRKLDVYGVCHGVNGLHNAARNEISKVYCFLQTETLAADYLIKNGVDFEKIKLLKPGQWISRSNTGEISSGGTAFQPKSA